MVPYDHYVLTPKEKNKKKLEEEEGSLWDFPAAQEEQKSIQVLLEKSILQCCKTICKTWWFEWPTLSCQRLPALLHGYTMNFSVLLHEFIEELTKLDKQ